MKLKAGVIGLGVMGKHHCRVLANLDEVEFVGVYDPSPMDFGLIENKVVLRDFDSFIALKPDYCVVAAPTIYHSDLGKKLAKAGIHALIEKPIASTVKEGQELVQVFDGAGVIGGVGHIERYNSALQEMRKRIEEGQLGEIFQIVTRRQGPFPGRIADVGVIKDLATHDIDLSAWVCQQSYTSVSARVSTRSGREHEDMLLAIGNLSGGAIASHTVNWLSPVKERIVVVTGERGALAADTLSADLTFYENGTLKTAWSGISTFRGVSEGPVVRYAFEKKEPLVSEHKAFIQAISTGDLKGIVSLADGLRVLEVAEKMIADSKSFRTI